MVGVEYLECLPIRFGCKEFSESNKTCGLCEVGYRKVDTLDEGIHVCIKDPAAQINSYLIPMLIVFFIVGLIVAVQAFRGRRSKKKLLSKLTNRIADGIPSILRMAMNKEEQTNSKTEEKKVIDAPINRKLDFPRQSSIGDSNLQPSTERQIMADDRNFTSSPSPAMFRGATRRASGLMVKHTSTISDDNDD